uniref:Calmodulin-binding heat-shock protein n=1 Tax=Solanum tuberosum TaxID=4113 RepID=M1BAH2_SOLTU
MSVLCGLPPLLECVYGVACARWAWKRCLHSAGHDSENWSVATAEEFEPVPRLCRYILGVYEDDLRQPQWEPPEGYGINPDCLIVKKNYPDTGGRAPPYLLYLDHDHADIVLAIRGLNLAKESDYAVLLDNKLGKRKFDGGYVHNGLLKAAGLVLNAECEIMKQLLEKYPNYTLTITGHSLGSGVAALLTMVIAQNLDKLGNIDRKRIRCFAIAPARCMSLNLADDFLPRTATPLEDIFKSLFCLPCLLCLRCMRDTCISEEKLLKDPRRLYAPGRLYHIVERKPFRCGRFPPVVKTAVPVDGRFEHIVLSCNATSDHAIIWIEREARRALELMQERDHVTKIPAKQKMERQQTLTREHNEEHKAALQRAVTLAVPDAFSPSYYGTFDELDEEQSDTSVRDSSPGSSSRSKTKDNWDELIERLYEKDESGHKILKRSRSQ